MEFFFSFVGTIALIICFVKLRGLKFDLKKLSERIQLLEARGTPAPETAAVTAKAAESPAPSPTMTVKAPPPPPPSKPMTPPRVAETTPPPPRVPTPPSPPGPIASAIRNFFTGGNLVVRIGLIVLFLGITFLLKLAIDNGLIPIQLRLAAVALGAIVMIGIGWRLKVKRPGFALSLLGGGIGVLYLNIFAAFRLYHLIPSGLAFGLLLLVVAFSSFIAVALNAQALAVIGICGGFLAPILTSTGGGSHVALFSYFLLLNLGVLGIAWFRAWRVLNLLGFFFTFGIGASWGAKFYQPELFATTEPFLVIFFLLYSLIPLLFASKAGKGLKGFVDTTLVFGTPLIGFGLQMKLVRDLPHGLAWSSLALAVYYVALTTFLRKRNQDVFRPLTEALLALAIVFITLTIPLRLNHQWTCLSWAIEGAALVWIGLRQNRIIARLFGVLVLFGSCFAYRGATADARGMILMNPYFIGAFFIAAANLMASFLYSKHRDRIRDFETPINLILFVIGMGWWFYAGVWEIGDQLEAHRLTQHIPNAPMLFVIASLVICELLHRPLDWPLLRKPAYLLLPALCFVFALSAIDHGFHPLTKLGWIVWPLGMASHFWFLKRIDRPDLNIYQRLLHAFGFVLLIEILCFESSWRFHHIFSDVFFDPEAGDTLAWNAGLVWASVVSYFWGVAGVVGVSLFRDKIGWPVKAQEKTYLRWALTPIVFLLWLWIFRSLSLNGESLLVPYVPIFNPLELLQAFFFLGAVAWVKTLPTGIKKPLYWVLGGTIFVWINALLARSVSHWVPIDYSFHTLYDSLVFQTSLTIYWTVLAMAMMVIGTRKKLRGAWMIGASLLGLTVMKLLFVDLSKTQTIARVVSFVGAGVIILLIGYFSPIPPKTDVKKETTS